MKDSNTFRDNVIADLAAVKSSHDVPMTTFESQRVKTGKNEANPLLAVSIKPGSSRRL